MRQHDVWPASAREAAERSGRAKRGWPSVMRQQNPLQEVTGTGSQIPELSVNRKRPEVPVVSWPGIMGIIYKLRSYNLHYKMIERQSIIKLFLNFKINGRLALDSKQFLGYLLILPGWQIIKIICPRLRLVQLFLQSYYTQYD